MYLQRIKVRPWEQLFGELRNICLSHDPNIFPYRNATFEVRLAHPRNFQPSASYVLRSELRFVALLLDQMAQRLGNMEAIDTLLEYENEFGEHWRMIPPIVEYTDFGEWMILDGEHRSFIADMRGVKIPMLFISGVDVRAPYVCTPLPQGWEGVKILDTVPATALKRICRKGLNDTEETKHYFRRDLSAFGSLGIRTPDSPI